MKKLIIRRVLLISKLILIESVLVMVIEFWMPVHIEKGLTFEFY